MAFALTLTDGSTTANLYDLSATFAVADGWQFAGGGDPETIVTETIGLLVTGANYSAVQTAIRTIERLLDGARRHTQTGIGPRVYLTAQLDGISEVRRTLVRDGALNTPKAFDQWSRRAIEASLIIERPNRWEANSETEIALSAQGQAADVGGRNVNNGANSWVQIAAGAIAGSIPTPIRLQLQNTTGASRAYSEVHVALNADFGDQEFAYFVEGESFSGGTVANNAACSNGQARQAIVNTAATLTYTLPAAQMQMARGGMFTVLARLQSVSAVGVSVRLELRVGGVTVWRPNEPKGIIRLTPQLVALGTVPLPPMPWTLANAGDLTLAVIFSSAASRTVLLDYVALLPASDYRLLSMQGYSLGNSGGIYDNGIDGWAGAGFSTGVFPVVSAWGKPIMLRPNTRQRLYIFQQTGADALVPDTFSVRAFYRPRSLTL